MKVLISLLACFCQTIVCDFEGILIKFKMLYFLESTGGKLFRRIDEISF